MSYLIFNTYEIFLQAEEQSRKLEAAGWNVEIHPVKKRHSTEMEYQVRISQKPIRFALKKKTSNEAEPTDDDIREALKDLEK